MSSSILLKTLLGVGEYWPDILESTVAVIVSVILVGYFVDLITREGAAHGMRDLGYTNIWRGQMSQKVAVTNVAAATSYGIGYLLITAYASGVTQKRPMRVS